MCAEGYLFELERRGYLQAGAFVPEAVLDHPDEVTALHRQFVHAGSDIVEAFTYYGHREKLRIIGKEDLLELLNRTALQLAVSAGAPPAHCSPATSATRTSTSPTRRLSEGGAGDLRRAGGVGCGGVRRPGDRRDDLVGRRGTIALESIRAAGLPAVVTMTIHQDVTTRDGYSAAEACRALAGAGADVVGSTAAAGHRRCCR